MDDEARSGAHIRGKLRTVVACERGDRAIIVSCRRTLLGIVELSRIPGRLRSQLTVVTNLTSTVFCTAIGDRRQQKSVQGLRIDPNIVWYPGVGRWIT